MKAIWNGKVLAESDGTVNVEGNEYFPPNTINKEFFKESDHSSVCPWKGTASYYNIEVDGKVNKDAAWYYPKTSAMAEKIRNYIAFWKGVEIVK